MKEGLLNGFLVEVLTLTSSPPPLQLAQSQRSTAETNQRLARPEEREHRRVSLLSLFHVRICVSTNKSLLTDCGVSVQDLLCEWGGRELASLRWEELVRGESEPDGSRGAAHRKVGRSVSHQRKQQKRLLRLLCCVSVHTLLTLRRGIRCLSS